MVFNDSVDGEVMREGELRSAFEVMGFPGGLAVAEGKLSIDGAVNGGAISEKDLPRRIGRRPELRGKVAVDKDLHLAAFRPFPDRIAHAHPAAGEGERVRVYDLATLSVRGIGEQPQQQARFIREIQAGLLMGDVVPHAQREAVVAKKRAQFPIDKFIQTSAYSMD